MATSDSSEDRLVPVAGSGGAEPHFERFLSTEGDTILIECDCPIGREHTYADWQARFVRDDS